MQDTPVTPTPMLPVEEPTCRIVYESTAESTMPHFKSLQERDTPRVPGNGVLGPALDETPLPADDLGFDRPLFGGDRDHATKEAETPEYRALIASTRSDDCPLDELIPTPPWPRDALPQEALFEHPQPAGPTNDSYPPAFCYEGGGETVHTGRWTTWRWLLAGGVATLIIWAVVIGLLVQRSRNPEETRPSLRARPAPQRTKRASPVPPPSRRREVLRPEQAVKTATHLMQQRDFVGAHLMYAAALEVSPHHQRALEGYARSGVELGHEHVLERLRRSGSTALRRLEPELHVRLWMARKNWARAAEAMRDLPRRRRRREPGLQLLQAELLHHSGRLERARKAFAALVERRHRLARRHRVEALIGLSEVLLKRNYRTASRSNALRALRVLGSDDLGGLRRRVELQLQRCAVALAR
jgi:hypothetical protein